MSTACFVQKEAAWRRARYRQKKSVSIAIFAPWTKARNGRKAPTITSDSAANASTACPPSSVRRKATRGSTTPRANDGR